MYWRVLGATAACASLRSSRRPRSSVEYSGISVFLRTCPSPVPRGRRRYSPRRAGRKPTSTNRPPERRLLAVNVPEVCPSRIRASLTA